MSQKDRAAELNNLLSRETIDWKNFFALDSDDDTFFAHFESRFSFHWLLSKNPPIEFILNSKKYCRFFFTNPKDCLIAALQLSSLESIQYINLHYADLLTQTLNEDTGDLPLHRAQTVPIAAVLFETFPQSVIIPNKALNLPLHMAIMHFKSPDLIRYLISRGQRYKKASVLENNLKGQSPFSLLCAQIDVGVDVACISFPLFRADLRLWQNLNTLLETMTAIDSFKIHQKTSTLACRGKYQALHSFISLSCPPSAICLAQMINPEQVHEADGMGRYPLSLAAEQRSCPGFILKRLMSFFPQAVLISDDYGRLPLHWAAISGKKWEDGLMLLFNRMPSAVSSPDNDGMYPFMLSAAAKDPSVECIYRLLRECPSIINF